MLRKRIILEKAKSQHGEGERTLGLYIKKTNLNDSFYLQRVFPWATNLKFPLSHSMRVYKLGKKYDM